MLSSLQPADARRFLGELQLADLGVIAAEDTLIGVLPPFSAAPVPERAVDPYVLRALMRAIRERRALEALYQSMSRPTALRRTIEPHALAHDGFRWHARAFDRESGEFRDFVLGRLSKPRLAGEARSRAAPGRRLARARHARDRAASGAHAGAVAGDRARLRHPRRLGEARGAARAVVLRAAPARPRRAARHAPGARAAHRAPQPRRGRGGARGAPDT